MFKYSKLSELLMLLVCNVMFDIMAKRSYRLII